MSTERTTRLRVERLQRRWTLTQLTQATGISTADISQMERGLRHAFPGWRARLSKAFGLPEETLFPESRG